MILADVYFLQARGSVSIEPVVSIVRYHATGGYGSPTEFSVTMLHAGEEAVFKDGRGEYTRAVSLAIKAKLREMGIKRWTFERITDGKHRTISAAVRC